MNHTQIRIFCVSARLWSRKVVFRSATAPVSDTFMLDTNICSFIMRERPAALLERMQDAVEKQNAIVVSVITYYEMLLGTIGPKASPRHAAIVDLLCWAFVCNPAMDRLAADEATRIRKELGTKGTPIGPNDAMIAGHAIAAGCVLVTNNVREFSRVAKLRIEDWTAG